MKFSFSSSNAQKHAEVNCVSDSGCHNSCIRGLRVHSKVCVLGEIYLCALLINSVQMSVICQKILNLKVLLKYKAAYTALNKPVKMIREK